MEKISTYLDFAQYKQKGIAPIAIIAIIGIILVGIFAVSKIPTNNRSEKADKAAEKIQQTQQSSNLYSNFNEGFNIEGPKDWKMTEQPNPDNPGIILQFDAPREGPDDKYKEHIGLSIQDFPSSTITLDKFLEIFLDSFKVTYPENAQVISKEKFTLGEIDAYKVIQTGSAKDADYKAKWMTYVIVKNNKGYLLNYAASDQTFDKYLDEVEKTFNSFKFGPQ